MFAVHMAYAVDSTQDLAMEAGRRGAPSGTCFFAEEQRLGRGRRVGDAPRRWVAPAGTSIQVSILSRHRVSQTPGPSLTLGVGVAVGEVLRGLGAEVRLKWPNDLILGGRKVGGILVEGQLSGEEHLIVIGLGLNVNLPLSALPEEVQGVATSLQAELGAPQDRLGLLGALVPSILEVASSMEQAEGRREVLQRWRRMAWVVGRAVEVERGGVWAVGTALGIDEEGALEVSLGSGEQVTVRSGEVRWLSGVV